MKPIGYKIISHVLLFATLVAFTIQTYLSFDLQYGINLSIYIPIGFSILFFILTSFILRLVSNLQVYSVYHKKIIMTIRMLIYTFIIITFCFWFNLLFTTFMFLSPDIVIDVALSTFFIKWMLMALLYSTFVNVFFISLSIRLPKKKENK